MKGAITMLPAILDQPTGIVEGPDGHMWVAEEGAGRIDRIDGTTPTPFAVAPAGSAPEDIVAGPDVRSGSPTSTTAGWRGLQPTPPPGDGAVQAGTPCQRA